MSASNKERPTAVAKTSRHTQQLLIQGDRYRDGAYGFEMNPTLAMEYYKLAKNRGNRLGEERYYQLKDLATDYIGSSKRLKLAIDTFGYEYLFTQAISNNRRDCLKALIQSSMVLNRILPADVLAKALFLAIKQGKTNMLAPLMQAGANVQARDKIGNNVMHIAARVNHIKAMGLLQTYGFEALNDKNNNGQTALQVATIAGHSEAVSELLERGANADLRNAKSHSALHLAARRGHSHLIDILATRASINLLAPNENTALMLAISLRQEATAMQLLRCNANAALKNSDGNTALHLAVLTGNETLVDVLLTTGVDLNAQNAKGDTALHLALANNNRRLTQRLIDANACLTIENTAGKSPASLMAKDAVIIAIQQTNKAFLAELSAWIKKLSKKSMSSSKADWQKIYEKKVEALQALKGLVEACLSFPKTGHIMNWKAMDSGRHLIAISVSTGLGARRPDSLKFIENHIDLNYKHIDTIAPTPKPTALVNDLDDDSAWCIVEQEPAASPLSSSSTFADATPPTTPSTEPAILYPDLSSTAASSSSSLSSSSGAARIAQTTRASAPSIGNYPPNQDYIPVRSTASTPGFWQPITSVLSGESNSVSQLTTSTPVADAPPVQKR